MRPRPSTCFGATLSVLVVAAAAAALHAYIGQQSAPLLQARGRALVARLGLTDLCLTTEAAYCRNPSLTDRRTAFQDHPAALEHFPSGSLVAPPPHLVPHDAPQH